ncbi:MAG: hypothetical protein D6824_05200 [Planctomycetota bacterium]|nr:MAG: hypothetical protein D6824_05200 [Planctomycetota bacterium]
MSLRPRALLLLLAWSCASGALATAQPARSQASEAAPAAPLSKAQIARNLLKPITVEMTDVRLEDAMRFVEQAANVPLEVLWRDSRFVDGLDPDQRVSVTAHQQPALALLETLLRKAQSGPFDENTWQFGPLGQVQVGPKSRLNRFAELRLYDVSDLMFQIGDTSEAPQIDLNNVLNQAQSGGGGSSGSIFGGNEEIELKRVPLTERVQQLVDLIRSLIEPDQWDVNGGDGGTIVVFGSTLLVRAPDYIHRQLVGYPFWPGSSPR